MNPLLCLYYWLSNTFQIHIAREQGDIQFLGELESNLKEKGK